MHAERPLTAGVPEDLDRVARIGVHGAHDEARHVGADGDQAEIERAAQSADVGKGRAVRKVRVRGGPVVLAVGGAGDGAVAGVAGEVDGFGGGGGGWLCGSGVGGGGGGGDGPGGPEGGAAVEESPGGDVLAG